MRDQNDKEGTALTGYIALRRVAAATTTRHPYDLLTKECEVFDVSLR